MRRVEPEALADAKRVSVSSIARTYIKLAKTGNLYEALCPFHKEKSPSFIIYHDHFHCFGCGKHGDGIAFLMLVRGIDFAQAVSELTNGVAYRQESSQFLDRQRESAAEYARAGADGLPGDEAERGRQAEARAIWQNAKPIDGTLAEIYLRRTRAISCPIPHTIRFAPSLFFAPARKELPALLAALQDGRGAVSSVQRIFLASDGRKAEPAKEAKRTKGPMRDGAVRLGQAGRLLGISGSVEDALSCRQLFSVSVWATCGENRLGALTLPPEVEDIVIFADADEVGKAAAFKAAEVYEAQGRSADVQFPPSGHKDFNSWLQARRK